MNLLRCRGFPVVLIVPLPSRSKPVGVTVKSTATTAFETKMPAPGMARPFVEISQAKVGRLNVGPIATNHIQWDQPHEGNLFDHLYARRAFQRAREAMAS